MDNNECVPNEDFMIEWSLQRGYDYDSLTEYEKDGLRQRYVVGHILSNPGDVMGRIIPFMDLWILPSTRESQRLILDDKSLKNYLWFTFILSIGGLAALIYRREAGKAWLYILVYYGICTIAYLMTYYLMRYRIYYRFFEILLASYMIFLIIAYFIRNDRLEGLLGKEIIKTKHLLLFLGIGIIIMMILLGPLYTVRAQTGYANAMQDFVGETIKIDFFDTRLPDNMGVVVSDDCDSMHLGPSPNSSMIIRSGIVEYYPMGVILRNEDDLREWIIKRARTLYVILLSDFNDLGSDDGRYDFSINVNGEIMNLPLQVYNGLVLSPDFIEYYITSCQ